MDELAFISYDNQEQCQASKQMSDGLELEPKAFASKDWKITQSGVIPCQITQFLGGLPHFVLDFLYITFF